MSSSAREVWKSQATRRQSGAGRGWKSLREACECGSEAARVAIENCLSDDLPQSGLEHSLCAGSRNELALVASPDPVTAISLPIPEDSLMAKALDRLDRRILDELQRDGRVSNQELAK